MGRTRVTTCKGSRQQGRTEKADNRAEQERRRAEDEHRNRQGAEFRARMEGNLARPTKFEEYIHACHTLLWKPLRTQTDKSVSTHGSITNPARLTSPIVTARAGTTTSSCISSSHSKRLTIAAIKNLNTAFLSFTLASIHRWCGPRIHPYSSSAFRRKTRFCPSHLLRSRFRRKTGLPFGSRDYAHSSFPEKRLESNYLVHLSPKVYLLFSLLAKATRL